MEPVKKTTQRGDIVISRKADRPNTPGELLAKAHGQVLLELVKKEVGWTSTSWDFEFSPENVSAFRTGFQEYRQRYGKLFSSSPAAKMERAGFLHFCGTHG